MAGLGQRGTHLDTHLGIRGSRNAGKLLLRLRIKQSLECSQLKAVLEALPVLPVSADPPRGCREGFGEHLEAFVLLVVPKGTSSRGV